MASIQRIADIQPIEGADKIVLAKVNSWNLVTAIDNGFNVGDLVIYCEIDSWIPHEIAPFLSKGQPPREFNGVKGERLRSIRLRGQISQGLILPLSVLPAGVLWEEGTDVSECLNIQKWEAPIPAQLAGIQRGNFPTQIPKTDEERVQNISNRDWAELSKHTFVVTEKLEGSSCTMAMINGEFHVCSRNIDLVETEDNTFWKLARSNGVEEKMKQLGCDNIAIQGEAIGPGIQGNHYELKQQEFHVFKMYGIQTGEYIPATVCFDLTKALGLLHVPVITTMSLSGLSQEDVVKTADGKSALNPNKLREGIVFRNVDGQEHFKAVSNDYLMKTGN